MERINTPKPRGITGSGLRIWGMLFLVVGILGRSLLQNRILGLGSAGVQELLEGVLSTETGMAIATVSLVMQALETMAAPVFCFLLVEGVQHTGDIKLYFARVAGVAVLSELPYNFAMSGKVLDLSSRNPVFGLVFALIMLYLYRRYEGKNAGRVLLRIVFTVAAVMWPIILKVQDGACCVILAAVLWLCREKKQYRAFIGCAAAACCSVLSPFYLAAPMGFMAIHFYRGEKGDENKLVNYLAYPALLIAAAVAVKFIG